MFKESDANAKFFSLINKSDYRSAVKLLKSLEMSYPKEYGIWVLKLNQYVNSDDYLQNNNDNTKLLIEYLIEIADEEIRYEVFDRIHWFEDWAKISPNEANELFESIIVKDNRDKNLISKYLFTYCYNVLPYIKYNSKEELKEKVLETEELIIQEEQDIDNIGSLIRELVIILVENHFFDMANEMIKKNCKFIKNSWHLLLLIHGYLCNNVELVSSIKMTCEEGDNINAKSAGLLLEEISRIEEHTNSINELELLNTTINDMLSYINSVNKHLPILAPKMGRQLKNVYKMLKNYLSVYEEILNGCINSGDYMALKNREYNYQYFPINADNRIYEYLKKYNLDRIDSMSEINLLEALKQFVLLDIGDKNVIKNCKDLLEHIAKFDLLEDEEYIKDLNDAVKILQDKLQDKVIDNIMENANEIIVSKGLNISIRWEEAEGLIRNIFNDFELSELKRDPEVERQLYTAEWVWQNSVKLITNNKFDEDCGQDLTFSITPYLKLVEIYLCQKLFQLAEGRIIKYYKGEPIHIGSDDYFKYCTAGNYISYFRNHYGELSKTKISKKDVDNSLTDWLNNLRNAHFHKDSVIKVSKAFEIREKTITLLSKLINNLK